MACGLSCPRHVGSSQTRDQTCVSCIGRQILYLGATWESPALSLGLYLQQATLRDEIMSATGIKEVLLTGCYKTEGSPNSVFLSCDTTLCGCRCLSRPLCIALCKLGLQTYYSGHCFCGEFLKVFHSDPRVSCLQWHASNGKLTCYLASRVKSLTLYSAFFFFN